MGKFRLFVDGVFVAEDRSLDLVAGSNVTLTVSDTEGDHTQPVITIAASGGAGAPTDADYLVGTANGSLSAEIAVGTSPGGELGGTWASPTVAATHSGSAHHARGHTHSATADGTTLTPETLNIPTAAAPAQTAEGQAVWDSDDDVLTIGDGTSRKTLLDTGHAAAADPHTGYILESLADAQGDLLLASAADTWARLAIGPTNGHVLTTNGTTASWQPVGAASHPAFASHAKFGVD